MTENRPIEVKVSGVARYQNTWQIKASSDAPAEIHVKFAAGGWDESKVSVSFNHEDIEVFISSLQQILAVQDLWVNKENGDND